MTEAWQSELSLVERILQAWSNYEGSSDALKSAGSRADIARSIFPEPFDSGRLKSQVKELVEEVARGGGSETRQVGGYISVAPVGVGTPALFPLITVAMRVIDGDLYLALRVVTFYEDSILGCVDAHGWRFDLADPISPGEETRDSHQSFPHVQRIIGWLPSKPTFFPPGLEPSKRGVGYGENMSAPVLNESRPAFPLPVRTPSGLLVSAMGALYGANVTHIILESVSQQPGAFRKEVSEILRR